MRAFALGSASGGDICRRESRGCGVEFARLGPYTFRQAFKGDLPMLAGKRILLIIGGGIAAYKALELIRLVQKAGGLVTPVLT